MVEALFKELKRHSQEAFKKKILFKLNYCVGVLCLHGTCTDWIIRKHRELIGSDRADLAYMLFLTVDGRFFKNLPPETVKLIEQSIEFIINKVLELA
jgi:hypothetical protein